MRALLMAVVVGLAVMPGQVRAANSPLRPTPIEAAAAVVVCMLENQVYSTPESVQAWGGVVSADLFVRTELLGTISRRAYDPLKEPWLARNPQQPPLTLDLAPAWRDDKRPDAPLRHGTVQVAAFCFSPIQDPH